LSAEQESPSYEQARDELIGIVEELEKGTASLEQSLALWERGEKLARFCQSWLDQAQQRLESAGAESPQVDEQQ